MFDPYARFFLGFSPSDGTIDFYFRVSNLASPQSVLLDYGAGRAAWFEDDSIEARRRLRSMRGKFSKVIAADVDAAVLENRSADEIVLITDHRLPLDDASIDVIVADYVIEHVDCPSAFASEVTRLLKPGGWFCARTPHKFHYVALLDAVFPKLFADSAIRAAQPGRKSADIFPKIYRMNTLRAISTAFPGWENHSFCRRSDPAYYFGSSIFYSMTDFLHRMLPASCSGNLFVFLQKPF